MRIHLLPSIPIPIKDPLAVKKPQAELDNERTIPREYKKEMKDMLEELDSNDELYKRTPLD